VPRQTQAQWMARISDAVREMAGDSAVSLNTRLENLEVVYNHVGSLLGHIQDKIDDEEDALEDEEDEDFEFSPEDAVADE